MRSIWHAGRPNGHYFFRVFLTKIGFFHINPCKQESIILKYIVKFGNTKHRKVEGNESD